MQIGFVVLCYGQYELCLRCVDYLRKLKFGKEVNIILVDNCSPDGTGQKLREYYKDSKNIFVILNDTNSGFAKGNNIGYKFAKEKLHCDCIIVMNSDVFIEDDDFLGKLTEIYAKEPNIAILAPDVLGHGNRHCNPLAQGVIPRKNIIKNIGYNTAANILFSLSIDYRKGKKKKNTIVQEPKEQYGIMPHGCCVIYGPEWTQNELQAFYPGTFLFCEEYFLAAYAKEMNYVVAYKPAIVVRHLGDASIEESIKNPLKKQMFINRCQNKSLIEYLRFEKDVKKNWNNQNQS